MTSTTPPGARSRTRTTLAITAVVLAVLIILFFIFANLYSDWLWFHQLGYLEVLTTQWAASVGMFFVGFVGMGLPVLIAVEVAFRSRPVYAKLNSQLDRYQQVIEPLRRLAMWGLPALFGVFMGASTSTHWPTVLEFLDRTSFGTKDPQFHLDVSFFVYELPFYHGLTAYASAVLLVAIIATLATCYLYGGIRISGREVRITRSARIQIAVTSAVYIAVQAWSIWLDQYSTETDPNGISDRVTGATYADIHAVIPGRVILAGIAVLVAILFLVTAAVGRWRLPLIGTALLIVSTLILGTIYPGLIQKLQVAPSERSLESTYINRNITATRDAYGVSKVKVVPYNATTTAKQGALRKDAETTANIRILDPSLVSATFSQLQQVQQYYKFNKPLNVDRYKIDGTTQDTVIAVRELNQSGQSSGGWYNDTLVYTHGYGIAAAYGAQRDSQGNPDFIEKDIPDSGGLGTFQPRIYFGESSPKVSIVGSKVQNKSVELDYPSSAAGSNGAQTTTYTASAGPKLDNLFTRLVYAIKFGADQIVLSQDVTDKSQILYDRNPVSRVQQVAPYLTTDSDAYPAVVNGRIVWIVDAYTTSDDYPYSQDTSISSDIADTNTTGGTYALDNINYIRNSVKATVDAYTGKVTLYAWDASDPVLKTWEKIFPGTVKSQSSMSAQLLAHVRYPQDLFKVQRAIIASYHVTNSGTFFSGNDKWKVPEDPTSTADSLQPPYYLTMQTPGTTKSAFTLYSSFIPDASASDSRSVLKGYLTADSDAGKDYGRLTLLTLPKDTTVPGPGQAQANFNTDTDVASQISLLTKGDTQVKYGNLLTLPVGGGLLYVQPLYVESTTGTQYPLLRKVLVGFGDKVAFEDTLDAALDDLFEGNSGASAGDANAGGGSTTTTTPPAGSSSTTNNTALEKALADYQTAFAARTKAYASGDLVAAAQDDQEMQAAVQAAIAATTNG